MNYILFDGTSRTSLLPFTYTRPVAEIRVGILTIREKWEKHLGFTTTTLTEDYLSEKYPMVEVEDNVMICASCLPNEEFVTAIKKLQPNQAIFYNKQLVAFHVKEQQEVDLSTYELLNLSSDVIEIRNTWDIFSQNDKAIKEDFLLLTKGRKSQPIPATNQFTGEENIFIEEGANVNFSILNGIEGPIYIGKNSLIMEGTMIRGPLALCDNAVIKMGSKIYGATTVGPYCTVGGEVNNSVLFSYSNKGHEGYLGNSVLGEWCNLGADTNTSNLKNNYAPVKLWSYETNGFANTGLQFCGLMVGDHSKCGINTMFNTGTVVGIHANLFGSGFPRNFVPSFSWGGSNGFKTYLSKKAYEVAEIVMKRKKVVLSPEDIAIYEHVFEETQDRRKSY